MSADRGNDINLPTPLSPRKQLELSPDNSNTVLPDIKASSTINRRKDTMKSDPFSPTTSGGDPKYDSKTFRNHQGASIANIKEYSKQLIQEDRSRMKPIAYTAISAPQFNLIQSSDTPLGLQETSPLKKQPKPEVADLIDGASLLSENEWVEIARYQREVDEEQIRKEKEARNNQKILIKNTLEQQLQEKKNKQFKEKQDKINYELELAK